jgi:hypothetical protein
LTAVWLDVTAARHASRRWATLAESLRRDGFDLERRLTAVALGEHTTASKSLVGAACDLWAAAALLRAAVDAAVAADTDRAGVTAAVRPCPSGDLGGTGDVERRIPYTTARATPVDRSRALLGRAFSDLDDECSIRADEFAVVRVSAERWVVVLPGVVDLTAPRLGWDPDHRSVRDLDRAAIGSSRSTSTADNPYARSVAAGLDAAGVPNDAELLIIGHSFGADTALDLAADPGFNGPDGRRVTHVVAAGYHSTPQLGDVPDGTTVLVLRNRSDVVVLAEEVGRSGIVDAVAERIDAVRSMLRFDLSGAAGHVGAASSADASIWRSMASRLASDWQDVARLTAGIAAGNGAAVAAAAHEFATADVGVTTPNPGQVVSVFEGGTRGGGHHPSNYRAHVIGTDEPEVVAFLRSLDTAGYTAGGRMFAVDVSVPDR